MHETHSLRRCVRECDRDGFDLCTPRRCALIGTTCVWLELGIWPHAGLLDDRGSSYAGSEIFYVEYVNEFTLLINTALPSLSEKRGPVSVVLQEGHHFQPVCREAKPPAWRSKQARKQSLLPERPGTNAQFVDISSVASLLFFYRGEKWVHLWW